jgi:GT2 family glycosyltransferase
MPRISASLVVYNTPVAELASLLATLSRMDLVAWLVVDNGAAIDPEQSRKLEELVQSCGGGYRAVPANPGFGAGHNLALRALAGDPTDFHLMLNPDISMEDDVLRRLAQVMEEQPSVGLMMPCVVYPDGSPQFVCKLSPSPLDFALRRFAPPAIKKLFQRRLDRYELRGLEANPCDKVPFLSGCFMFARRSVLEAVGGFDERYFLYMEDVDLCRRVARRAKLLYWPYVTVTHGSFRGAYRNTRLLWAFLRSAVRYFNRWGWIFDAERRAANRAALACLPAGRDHTEA